MLIHTYTHTNPYIHRMNTSTSHEHTHINKHLNTRVYAKEEKSPKK